MRDCRHPNVCSFHDAFLVNGQTELWVVLDFMDGGDLTGIIDAWPIDERQNALICRETTAGLAFLHERNIIHRDIKSDNVLVSATGAIKISPLPQLCAVMLIEQLTLASAPSSRIVARSGGRSSARRTGWRPRSSAARSTDPRSTRGVWASCASR